MRDPIFSKVRPAQIPKSFKQKILGSCQQAFLEPSENIVNGSWLDSCLRVAAATAVLLFALTCYFSFGADHTILAATRFSGVEVSNARVLGFTPNTSMILVRRKTSWQ